jgi:cell division transport system permease protein
MMAMSGSYDDRSGRPPPHPKARPDFDPFDDLNTGPATGPATQQPGPPPVPQGNYAYAYEGYEAYDDLKTGPPPLTRSPPPTPAPLQAPQAERASEELYAPAKPGTKKGKEQLTAPVIPAGSVTGRSLTLVITIMCFLACLTAAAVYMINQSADAWLRDIASEVTVQIEPQENVDVEKTITDVSGFLSKQKGIVKVKPLDIQSSSDLLEPWLGKTDVLKSLPVPRLIALEVDRTSPPDLDAIRKGLEGKFKGASLDDHRRWQQQIRTVTRSFALGGLAILLLVAAATTAIIVSATKSSMASNREIVEVLHFVGATDRYIAREFEKHFLRLGIRAGLVGAASALLVFAAMPAIMTLLGGGQMTATELQNLIGGGGLDMAGYVLLGIVVVIIAALCMLTSRLGVYRILNARA